MRRFRATRSARRGQRSLRRQDWRTAAAAYQAAVDRDPTRAGWHARLGYAHLKARNWTAAAHAYQAAIAREPDRPTWYHRLGIALEKTGTWPAAAQAFREADRRSAAHPSRNGRLPSERLPFDKRVDLSIVPKPAYGYGLLRGARLAGTLGVQRMAAVELGVAGGRGLLAMEQHAATVQRLTGVGIDVYGFDTGEGLYEPTDHRDMPYHFTAGNYTIDVPRLEQRLEHAQLVLGNAGTTFPEFLLSGPARIGLISFDMDLYSATSAVLGCLGDGADEERFLPRMTVYFDDVVGRRGQDYHEFAGELLAIAEFNRGNETVKLVEDRRFRTLPINAGWHHGVYTMHRFQHPEYATYVGTSGPTSLRLRARD